MYSELGQACARAEVRGGDEHPALCGQVWFYQRKGSVLTVIKVSGLPRDSKTGFFAFHIHEGERCSGENFSDTGGHFNPSKQLHPRHAGDLPPLLSCSGRAYMQVMTNRFTVKDIIGKTVVIHNGADDFESQPAGNAGTKIACGVIKRV